MVGEGVLQARDEIRLHAIEPEAQDAGAAFAGGFDGGYRLHAHLVAAGELVHAEAALEHEDGIARQQRAEFLPGFAVEHRFEAAGEILDAGEGAAVALLAQRAHRAGQHERLQVGVAAAAFALRRAEMAVDLAGGAGGDVGQQVAPGIGRVAREVMAEGVAFAGEALRDRPLRDDRQHEGGDGRAGGAEHVVLPGLRVARLLLGGAHGLRQLRHQAGAGRRQRVERA